MLPVLQEHLSFSEVSSPFTNIITGQIYSEKITEDLLSFEKTGKSIHEPIKKIMLQTCKSAIKAKKIKVNDKTKELRGNCNLFARCALIQGKRHIDMRVIIGDYELTVVPKCLFSSDGSLLDGSKSKSDAVAEILKVTEVEPTDQIANKTDFVVFDAMRVLNEMSTKWFKTGKDLSNEFLRRIDSISSDAGLQIVVFDTCDETPSLKDKTRISRKQLATPPPDFNVNLETDIEKVAMSELLASKKNKRSIFVFEWLYKSGRK